MAITKVTSGVIADDAVTTTKILDGTIVTGDIASETIASGNMAVDPTNASNLSSGLVPTAQLGNVPIEPLEDDIAVLGFQVAAAADVALFNLRDQIVNTFQDNTGVDASASTDEIYDTSGKYWTGAGTITEDNPTGGTITSYGSPLYKVHSFLSGATNFVVSAGSGSIDVLLVAGGGGGGRQHGGGGGAGGVIVHTGYTMGSGTYAVTVGAGGPSQPPASESPGPQGPAGNPSSIAALYVAVAGGGGDGGAPGGGGASAAGGSGGGGANGASAGGPTTQVSAGTIQPGASQYGYAGGNGAGAGGGGGGASAVGTASSGNAGKPGGAGVANDYRTGSNVTYGGGGGGGGHGSGTGTGGAGGGGAGGAYSPSEPSSGVGTAGGVNTGGGGGGGGSNDVGAAAGGSGIVVIRYLDGAFTTPAYNDMTIISSATTAEAGTTATGDVVLLYTPEVGTTVLNTNLKAYVSRDNGTTYTQAILTGKGSYSGTTQIATSHNVDISAQPAGVTMRWKVETLVQSVSLQTRLNGMSLGWA